MTTDFQLGILLCEGPRLASFAEVVLLRNPMVEVEVVHLAAPPEVMSFLCGSQTIFWFGLSRPPFNLSFVQLCARRQWLCAL